MATTRAQRKTAVTPRVTTTENGRVASLPLPTFKAPEEPATPANPQNSQPLNLNGSPNASENIPTDHSSTGDDGAEGPRVRARGPIKPEQVTGAVGALVSLALLGTNLVLKYTRNRKLRRPTREQVKDFSEPIGRLLARHVDMSIFGPDLLDLAEAGSAFDNYLSDGPLTDRIAPAIVQVGMEQTDEPTERITYTETYGTERQPDEADWIGDNPHVTTLQ